jgi:hypothetical protein
VLVLLCSACGDEADEDEGGDAGAGTCAVAGRETDLCKVWVRRELSCSTPSPAQSEAMLLDLCQADWGGYSERVAPCFVAELGDCLASGCGSDDECYSDALVTYDPSLVDTELYDRCRTTPDAAGCEDVIRGFLRACLARADECDVFDDLCSSVAAMEQPYRADGEACLARSCAELEACFYAAMRDEARATQHDQGCDEYPQTMSSCSKGSPS